jgi:hypothetical protein
MGENLVRCFFHSHPEDFGEYAVNWHKNVVGIGFLLTE